MPDSTRESPAFLFRGSDTDIPVCPFPPQAQRLHHISQTMPIMVGDK